MSDSSQGKSKSQNRLAHATSPYLRQHAHNPVLWCEWNDESLRDARNRELPIFLSIGYAACHWCHVMERESFENQQIAEFLNSHFVCIKVDREERPDLDHLYMTFTQAMTGSGGWPMSVFLTPELKPFYAGTYFPPDDQHGRPGFLRLVSELARLWRKERTQITTSADEITGYIREHLQRDTPATPLEADLLGRAANGWMKRYDQTFGGFGGAPKFPHPTELTLILRNAVQYQDAASMQAVRNSLTQMIRGGIYDQIGGGFHRYSVDARWLVPHFEKMLYDNALLLSSIGEYLLQEPDGEILRAVNQTMEFLGRELRDESGLYYSSIDADSEGEEGKFYVWSATEFRDVSGKNASVLCRYFDVTDEGNFEGSNILHRTDSYGSIIQSGSISQPELDVALDKLFTARSTRPRPITDTKLLTSWNSLLIAGCVDASIATSAPAFATAAVNIALQIHSRLWDGAALAHGLSDEKIIPGEHFEDYAYLLFGLTRLLAADNNVDISADQQLLLYKWAEAIARRAMDRFMDSSRRCYLRPPDTIDLLIRPQENNDSALPSPVGQFTRALIQFSQLTGRTEFRETAEEILTALSGELQQYPDGMASLVMAHHQLRRSAIEIIVVGDYPDNQIRELRKECWSHGDLVLHSRNGTHLSLLFDNRREQMQCIYVCTNNVCQAPVATLDEAIQLREQLIRSVI